MLGAVIIEAILGILELFIRLLVMVVAIPFILLWPRADKSENYWAAVWRRIKSVLNIAMS